MGSVDTGWPPGVRLFACFLSIIDSVDPAAVGWNWQIKRSKKSMLILFDCLEAAKDLILLVLLASRSASQAWSDLGRARLNSRLLSAPLLCLAWPCCTELSTIRLRAVFGLGGPSSVGSLNESPCVATVLDETGDGSCDGSCKRLPVSFFVDRALSAFHRPRSGVAWRLSSLLSRDGCPTLVACTHRE